MKIELVYWRDAYFMRDAEGNSLPHKDYIMEAVGFTEVQGRFLRIAAEHDRQTKSLRAVTWVPLDNIVERIPLYRAPEPDPSMGTAIGQDKYPVDSL